MSDIIVLQLTEEHWFQDAVEGGLFHCWYTAHDVAALDEAGKPTYDEDGKQLFDHVPAIVPGIDPPACEAEGIESVTERSPWRSYDPETRVVTDLVTVKDMCKECRNFAELP